MLTQNWFYSLSPPPSKNDTVWYSLIFNWSEYRITTLSLGNCLIHTDFNIFKNHSNCMNVSVDKRGVLLANPRLRINYVVSRSLEISWNYTKEITGEDPRAPVFLSQYSIPPVSVCPNEEPTSRRHRTNSHKIDSDSESRVKFMTVRERKVYRVVERDCEQLLRF